MATPNETKWIHYRGRLANAELVVELESLKELVRFASDHRLRAVYSLVENGLVTRFAVSHKGGLVTADSDGFTDLNDHRDALANGFADAKAFYAAREKGFTTDAAYQLSLSSSLDDPETYKEMVAKGFVKGFDEYGQLLADGKILTPLGDINDAHRLYSIAQERSFEKWVDMQVAIEKGFADQHQYRIAQELKYPDAASLEEGRAGGFINADEWRIAKAKNCQTRAELQGCLDLETMKAKDLAHDAKLLVILLSRLPANTKVTLTKLQQLLEKELLTYQDPVSMLFRPWFTTQLRSRTDLANLLRKTDMVKEYGSYDQAREEFVSHRLHDRKVVLDGSNVAYNSQGNKVSIPTVQNMILMVEQLKKKGFKDVDVIVDASLKHRLSDMDKMPELEKICSSYLEVPAHTSADIMVIQHVKAHHCLMVSNDQFREWKALDPWIEDNIDYYRITFNITEQEVLLPDLEQ
ncbi:MAG: hypothetical protein K9J06_08995 [Flavobacteriales bacterium]|nr:hypothetical protein [Flavobacteriales bacterium]